MTQVLLRETAVINLDGSGNGTAKVGPLSAREIWNPSSAHVQVATNTKEATCAIYVGSSAIQSYFRDQTFSGSSGDSTSMISADVVKTGQYVWAVWSGGDASKQATLTVLGTKTV